MRSCLSAPSLPIGVQQAKHFETTGLASPHTRRRITPVQGNEKFMVLVYADDCLPAHVHPGRFSLKANRKPYASTKKETNISHRTRGTVSGTPKEENGLAVGWHPASYVFHHIRTHPTDLPEAAGNHVLSRANNICFIHRCKGNLLVARSACVTRC